MMIVIRHCNQLQQEVVQLVTPTKAWILTSGRYLSLEFNTDTAREGRQTIRGRVLLFKAANKDCNLGHVYLRRSSDQ